MKKVLTVYFKGSREEDEYIFSPGELTHWVGHAGELAIYQGEDVHIYAPGTWSEVTVTVQH